MRYGVKYYFADFPRLIFRQNEFRQRRGKEPSNSTTYTQKMGTFWSKTLFLVLFSLVIAHLVHFNFIGPFLTLFN